MHSDVANSTKEADTIRMLNEMDLTGMADELEEMLRDSQASDKILERLYSLVRKEYDGREFLRDQMLRHSANLRYPEASLDKSADNPARNIDTDLLNMLAECGWIRKQENVIITGAVGTGKSYLASALGVRAIAQGLKVHMVSGPTLLYDLSQAQSVDDLYISVRKTLFCNLLIIDDFSLMSFDRSECRVFFNLIDAAQNGVSLAILSALPPARWHELFESRPFAEAITDRIMHNAYLLEIGGKNMRHYFEPDWDEVFLTL